MKALLLSTALLFAAPAAMADDPPAAAEDASMVSLITVNVNGMVCDFCARAVTKTFGKEDAVETVDVDLDAGAILITLKPGKTLDDARIADLVKKSGYALVSIDRSAA